ncbi:hypothetical protein RhiTH_000023 [Rhizoctonia solani]
MDSEEIVRAAVEVWEEPESPLSNNFACLLVNFQDLQQSITTVASTLAWHSLGIWGT